VTSRFQPEVDMWPFVCTHSRKLTKIAENMVLCTNVRSCGKSYTRDSIPGSNFELNVAK